MTIQKAIEILHLKLSIISRGAYPDQYDAMRLAIEALKRLQTLRNGTCYGARASLPGETE